MQSKPGLLIYNASAGTAQKFPPAQLLAELPPGTRLHEFAEGEDPQELARAALKERVSWIAVAGGDGTVEAVASILADSRVPLGVIPCGTYNNFARSANLPPDPIEAACIIREGFERPIDVGLVNGRAFFECVGAGLDAALFPLGDEIKSGGLTKWFDLFRRAGEYPRQNFELELDRPVREALIRSGPSVSRASRGWLERFKKSRRTVLRLRALMITVSNGPYYGMNFAVAPDASIDNGRLTVTIFKRFSKLELFWHYFSIRSGRRVYAPRLAALSVARIKIRGERRTHAHADGMPFDQWPLDIEVRPGALRIFSAPTPPPR